MVARIERKEQTTMIHKQYKQEEQRWLAQTRTWTQYTYAAAKLRARTYKQKHDAVKYINTRYAIMVTHTALSKQQKDKVRMIVVTIWRQMGSGDDLSASVPTICGITSCCMCVVLCVCCVCYSAFPSLYASTNMLAVQFFPTWRGAYNTVMIQNLSPPFSAFSLN